MIELACRVRRGAFAVAIEADLARRATGIFGPSGAGKSTLLMALAGLVPVDSLRLVIDGETVVDTRAGIAPAAHRRRVRMVFQDHRLFPHLSVEANLRYGTASGNIDLESTFREVISLLEIGDLLRRKPDQCSGGERQRVALGRALVSEPRLLLLDEPLASLDRGLKRQILPYLRRVRERFDLPMIVVSHDLGELLALTDDLLLMRGGELRGHGDLVTLASDPETLTMLHDSGMVVAQRGVVSRRDEDGLRRVRIDGPGGLELACGDCQAAVGERVEVLLRPEDLVVAVGTVQGALSVSNRISGVITRMTRSPARCLLVVECGGERPFLAEVTERAIRELGLEVGVAVTLMSKAQAVQTRELGGRAP